METHPQLIYLDYNATTPLAPSVLDRVTVTMRQRWGNPSSAHGLGRQSRAVVEEARRQIGDYLGVPPAQIVFTSGGTEANNLALRGVARALRGQGRHLVTSAIEHPSVRATCRDLANDGWSATYLPVNEHGVVELSALEESLRRPGTVLVSVMHANNETGVIQPIAEISRLAHQHGVLVHADAVQSMGKIPCRVDDLGADLISFSAHKFYGPKGIGALYVKKSTPLVETITGGAHEHGRRAGTENVAGIVGMAEAMRLSLNELDEESARLQALRDQLERKICAKISRVKINGGAAPRVPNTSNICFEGVDGESLLLALELSGICASTGSACATGETEPSPVLLAMGLSPRQAQGVVRFSLGKHTTEPDIDMVVQKLDENCRRLRAISSVA